MHRIDGQGAVASAPTPQAVGAVVGHFAAAGAVPPTQITGDWLNAIQEEIVNAIDNITGEALSKSGDNAQLYRAIVAGLVGGATSISEVSTEHKALVIGSTTSAVFGDSSVLASTTGVINGDRCAMVACAFTADEWAEGGGVNGNQCFVAASESTGNGNLLIDGDDCALVASLDGILSGNNGFSAASSSPDVGPNEPFCAIIAAEEGLIKASSGTNPQMAVLLASRLCNIGLGANSLTARQHVVAGGYSAGSVVAPSWRLESNGGNMRSTNAHTTSGLDYAELFPNGDGTPHAPGRLITRRGAKAHLAQPGDRILGPVSVTPTVIGGDDGIAWSGRHKRDRWGAIVWEDVEVEREVEDPKSVEAYRAERNRLQAAIRAASAAGDWDEAHTLADEMAELAKPARVTLVETVRQMAVDPKWDPSREQVSRQDRPDQWTVVGLLGQVRVAIGAEVVEGDALMPGKDGVGVKATREYLLDGVVEGGARVEVMQILEPYSEAEGFGVALCLVR